MTGRIRTTCPRDCYDSCGMVVELADDGSVGRVLGDPDHAIARGRLCAKCAIAYNGVWLDPAARLATPLLRDGAKGSGRFRPATWDEATALVAARFGAVAADDPALILNVHYTGTCSVLANAFPMRFFNALGAREVEPDSVCNLAGHLALDYVFGTAVAGFDPRTLKDAACIVVWGCNPSASAPHADRHWLAERPCPLVVVDPIRTATAARADLHLRPRPGSDAALAFAILHVLSRDGRLDRGFIARHTIGWDAMAPTVADCTPAWGERATGVPAADIERAAALYGAGPAMLWIGQALCRQAQGGNIVRAVATLPAVTGNVGRPGTGVYFLNGKGATRGLDMGSVARPDLNRRRAPPLSHMDLAAALEDAGSARALAVWNMNPAASNPEQGRLCRALARDDLFTVVADCFMTDTARFADVVLPAASFLEFDDLVGSYMHLSLSAQAKVRPAPGEAVANQEIFRRIARAMRLDEPALYEDDRSVIDRLLAGSGLGIGFDELKRRGTVPVAEAPVILHAGLAFPTPSGRIEIASARAAADGLPATPQPTVDVLPRAGRLRLLTPASAWRLNSSYDNDARIRERAGPPTVTVHPADAGRLGLADGGRARVWNDTGSLVLAVRVSEMTTEGTAWCPKGRWPGLDAAGAGINALNPGRKADMGASTAVHSTEVRLAPA